MRIIFSLINSMTISMTICLYLFNWMWLQMRVNIGHIFLLLFVVIGIILFAIAKKISNKMQFFVTIIVFILLTLMNLILLGFDKILVISASILRNGINQNRIALSNMNIFLFVFYVISFCVLFITYFRTTKK